MNAKPGYKECPFCAELIRERATYCRFCRKMLPIPGAPSRDGTSAAPFTPASRLGMAELADIASKGLHDLLQEDVEAAAEAERRVITIMFADLCGYTALSEERDPEYMRELINRCFEKMAAAVEHYGGMVVHFLGDAVLAVFGVPRAHEDDPERAVRAGLDMIEGVRKVGKARRLDLGLSVGIHTGEVVVGGISVGERIDFTAFGDAVNTTARLQGVAGFREILISDRVFHQVDHVFNVENRPPATVKNKREPIHNYRVLGPKPRQHRRPALYHGKLARLIGRERELHRLEQAARLAWNGVSGLVCLVGEPGVGKTRLAWELRNRLQNENPRWLEAGCVSFGSAIPYGPVLGLLRSTLRIEDSDSAAQALEKVRQGCGAVPGLAPETRDALAYLLCESSSQNPLSCLSPKQRKESLIAESIRFVKALAAQQPTVLMLDDFHWTDPLSAEWLDRLVGEPCELPLLVLVLYRPTLRHAWPERSNPVLIDVTEISDADSRSLLLELMGVRSLPSRLMNTLLQRTRGNPFFLEELIYALRDGGLLKKQGPRWELSKDFEAAAIPDTLRNVILARIDLLELRLRRVLQCASVIGHGFRYRVLQYVADFEARLDDYVHQLIEEHFLIEESMLPELFYLFRHAIAHDVIYETLLKRRRAEFHRKVARCLETLYPDQLERHYEFLAYHYYLSDDPQLAACYLEKAAEKLERLYANEALVEALQRLLEVLDARLPPTSASARMRAEALIRLGRARYYLGEYEASAGTYQRAIRVADRLAHGSEVAALARRNFAEVERLRGRPASALRHLQRAEEIWERAGNTRERLTVLNCRGVIQMSQGKYGEAASAFRRAVELTRGAGMRDALANALNDLGIACLHGGQYPQAGETFSEALGLMEERGDKRGLAAALNNLGMCAERLGKYQDALDHYGRSFELAQKINYRYVMLANLINIGQCHQYQGDHKAAIRQFRRVIRMTDEQPNAYARSVALGNWATSLVALGDLDGVPACIAEAHRLADESQNHLAKVNADLAETAWLTAQGKHDDAIRLVRKAIADIEKHGYGDYRSLAYRYLAEAAMGRGQPADARRAADKSLRTAEATGNLRDHAWVLWAQARIEHSAGDNPTALALCAKARRIAETIGDETLLSHLARMCAI